MNKTHPPMIRSQRRGLWSAPIVLSGFLMLGCAGSKLLDHARHGQHRALAAELQRHPPSNATARQLAQETLSFEVSRAQDRVDRSFIRSLAACSAGLSSALSTRARIKDGVGAEAAMLLVEMRQLAHVDRFAEDQDGAWRALAARQSTGAARTRYFSDADERVRLAALGAAEQSPDPGETADLLEVVRLDPSRDVKLKAIGALAQLDEPSIAQALRDHYPALEESVRIAVVEAWGTAPLLEHGGRAQLKDTMGQRASLETVVAAGILARDPTPELYNPALTRLERLMSEGTLQEQRLALIIMPLHHGATTRLLLDAARAAPPELAVIAWSRLLGHDAYRDSAERALLQWVNQRQDESLALQAQSALAAGGSRAIGAVLRAQLKSASKMNRRWAAFGLVRLGALSDASVLVADQDSDVRRSVACRILSAPQVPVRTDN